MQIDKNIPVPSKTKYPFGALEIGDSFLAPDEGNVRGAAVAYALRHRGYKFKTMKVDTGIRVWRIEVE